MAKRGDFNYHQSASGPTVSLFSVAWRIEVGLKVFQTLVQEPLAFNIAMVNQNALGSCGGYALFRAKLLN